MDVNWEMLVHTAAMEMMKIFVPVIVVLVAKWIVEIIKKLSEKNPGVAQLIAYAAKLGYAAAEDYFRNLKEATGEDKMTYAIFRASDYLSNVGVSIDRDVLKDAITDYGVNEIKFSWVKPSIEDLFWKIGKPEDGLDPEEAEEVHEPGIADYFGSRDFDNGHNADRDQSGQQSAGRDQETAADEDGK